MNLVADENIWASMIRALREKGHRVYSIAEEHPAIDDPTVLDLSRRREELLLTSDKGFGALVFDERRPTAGVLLLRLREYEAPLRNALVLDTLQSQGAALLNNFSVLTLADLRMREI